MSASVIGSLMRKLAFGTTLHEQDCQVLEALPVITKEFAAHQHIVREGDTPDSCCLVIDGFAYRSKMTSNGGRQILSFHLPGDIPDLQSLYLTVMDHNLLTAAPSRLGFISHAALRGLIRARSTLAEALWRDTLVDAAIFREWIVNLGRRDATTRMAHMMSELLNRAQAVGLVQNGGFYLPVNQRDLADALGISTVHVNRVLQDLRAQNILEFRHHHVTVDDADRLADVGDFDGLYLHQRVDQ